MNLVSYFFTRPTRITEIIELQVDSDDIQYNGQVLVDNYHDCIVETYTQQLSNIHNESDVVHIETKREILLDENINKSSVTQHMETKSNVIDNKKENNVLYIETETINQVYDEQKSNVIQHQHNSTSHIDTFHTIMERTVQHIMKELCIDLDS